MRPRRRDLEPGVVDLDVVEADRERRLARQIAAEVDGEVGALVRLGRVEGAGEGLRRRRDVDHRRPVLRVRGADLDQPGSDARRRGGVRLEADLVAVPRRERDGALPQDEVVRVRSAGVDAQACLFSDDLHLARRGGADARRPGLHGALGEVAVPQHVVARRRRRPGRHVPERRRSALPGGGLRRGGGGGAAAARCRGDDQGERGGDGSDGWERRRGHWAPLERRRSQQAIVERGSARRAEKRMPRATRRSRCTCGFALERWPT